MASEEPTRTWERPTVFYNEYVKYLFYIGSILFVLWSMWEIRITPQRFLYGWSQATGLLADMYPPAYGGWESREMRLLRRGVSESIYIAMVATVTGIAVSIPVAFMAAENLVPKPIYYLNRGIITISRSLHALIVAIIFVKAFGFGAFAGVMTLTFKSIGFFSKLMAEDIEDIDMGQLEAIQATGANKIEAMIYGVVPQIMPRFVGLSVYRWDINLRASTIIGIVGAGGIGATLVTSVDSFQYDLTASILLVIIAIVMIAEGVSSFVRGRVN